VHRSHLWVPVQFAILVGGIEAGFSATYCPIPLVATLLGLGLVLGRRCRLLSWATFGLLLGSSQPTVSYVPDPDVPVTLSGRLRSDWRASATHHSARFDVETLAQRGVWKIWHREVILNVPPKVALPSKRRLRVVGYLHRASPIANGQRMAGRAWSLWVRSGHFIQESEVQTLAQLPISISHRMQRLVAGRLRSCSRCSDSQGVALATALTLGHTDTLDSEWRPCLGRAGLVHLLALSGLHVGLIAMLVWLACAGLPIGIRRGVVALFGVAYLLAAGLRPSLVRATLMLLGGYGAHALSRPRRALHGLACVATGMLVLSPELSRNLGFLLTVSATAGILYLAPRLSPTCSMIPKVVRAPLGVTLAAQISTLPWVLPTFHYLSPTSPLWNVIMVPWLVVFLLVSISWTGVLFVSTRVANLGIPVLDLLSRPLETICSLGPRWSPVLPSDAGFWTALIPLVVISVVLKWPRCWWIALIGIAACLPLSMNRSQPDPQLIMLDVGQGEALVVRDRREALLIDGGGWRSGDIARAVLLPALGSLGIRSLTGVLMTHPDLDHCRGLVDLSRYLELSVVWIGTGWPRSYCIDQLGILPGSRLAPLWRGQSLKIGRWELLVLHPAAGTRAQGNSESLVLWARVSGHNLLLTGDMDVDAERRILDDPLFQQQLRLHRQVTLLKVAHHGSRTSTSQQLLDRVRPRLALISCGWRNRYHHPSAEVTRRLDRQGVPVLRTDLTGAVVVTLPTDGPVKIGFPGSPKA